MYKRILLAYDGSESGQRALIDCQEIAQLNHSELFLIAVMPLTTAYVGFEGGVYESSAEERAQVKQKYNDILADGLRRLAESGRSAKGELLVGETVDAITQFAQKIDADLIVVGHKHLDGWAARWWQGSMSRSLIEYAHCSVLVVITH
ncbi:MAG: universal stress protein [Betaproteobacteria bacterium]